MNKSTLVFLAFWTDTRISNCRYVLYVYIRHIETVLSANYSTYMFVRVDTMVSLIREFAFPPFLRLKNAHVTYGA